MSNWICSQLGAREHFAVPRALYSRNRLTRIFTDLRRPGLEDIERTRVTTFPLEGFKWWWKIRSSKNAYEDFLKVGSQFSKAVREKLLSEDVAGKTFFGYDTGFLETATELKERGAKCIVGQMDPGRTEFDLVAEERKLWPDWEEASAVPEAYHFRREAEWEISDQIIVNSNWSRDALMDQGVPAEKLIVIPLSYEAPSLPKEKIPNTKAPLRVLWLGQVNLRKGIPYLLQAAEMLKREPIEFTIAGPIHVSARQVSKAPDNARFTGRVGRSEASTFYREADLFILPTISDGFAITQLEAMAHGLPVITTTNAGQVVDDGKNGFIIPIRDAKTLSERILELAEDRAKLADYAKAAILKSGEFGLDKLACELLSLNE